MPGAMGMENRMSWLTPEAAHRETIQHCPRMASTVRLAVFGVPTRVCRTYKYLSSVSSYQLNVPVTPLLCYRALPFGFA